MAECMTHHHPINLGKEAAVRPGMACATGDIIIIQASLVDVSHPVQILPGLQTTSQMGTGPIEQALIARTEKGLLVICGCAHPGVARMVARARTVGRGDIGLVVGGFRLHGYGPWQVRKTLFRFRRLGVRRVAPCHCTGHHAREMFSRAYGESLHPAGAGWQWTDLA